MYLRKLYFALQKTLQPPASDPHQKQLRQVHRWRECRSSARQGNRTFATYVAASCRSLIITSVRSAKSFKSVNSCSQPELAGGKMSEVCRTVEVTRSMVATEAAACELISGPPASQVVARPTAVDQVLLPSFFVVGTTTNRQQLAARSLAPSHPAAQSIQGDEIFRYPFSSRAEVVLSALRKSTRGASHRRGGAYLFCLGLGSRTDSAYRSPGQDRLCFPKSGGSNRISLSGEARLWLDSVELCRGDKARSRTDGVGTICQHSQALAPVVWRRECDGRHLRRSSGRSAGFCRCRGRFYRSSALSSCGLAIWIRS